MKLWIFGHSVCLPYDLESHQAGWPQILGDDLKITVTNFAQPAADNLYIYASYQQNKHLIQTQDKVIVGWSHPCRKSFVLDRQNLNHLSVLDQSLIYPLQNCELMRSKNGISPSFSHWKQLQPATTGKKFYDTWFMDYYSQYEQLLNLQSYYDSIAYTCAGQYIPFFFSKESVKNLNLVGVGHILEFIHDNKVAISDTNMHLNAQGHRLWANHLKEQICL